MVIPFLLLLFKKLMHWPEKTIPVVKKTGRIELCNYLRPLRIIPEESL